MDRRLIGRCAPLHSFAHSSHGRAYRSPCLDCFPPLRFIGERFLIDASLHFRSGSRAFLLASVNERSSILLHLGIAHLIDGFALAPSQQHRGHQ